MTTYNHDPSAIADGAALDPDAMKDILGDLDAAQGNLATMPTTYKDNLAGAIGEVHGDAVDAAALASDALADAAAAQTDATTALTRVNAQHNTDGSHKNSSVPNAALASNAVTDPKIAAGEVKARALDSASVPGENLWWDPRNTLYPPGMNFGGKGRWLAPVSQAWEKNYANNPSGGTSLVHLTTSGTVGRKIYASELGIKEGDTLRASIDAYAASGSFTLNLRAYNSSDVAIGTVASHGVGAVSGQQTFQTSSMTVPADTYYVLISTVRSSGDELYIHETRLTRGDFASTLTSQTPRIATPGRNIVFDVNNWEADAEHDRDGGLIRFLSRANMSVIDDTDNPYTGRTLVVTADAGRVIRLDEANIAEGDTICFAVKGKVVDRTNGGWSITAEILNVNYGAIASSAGPTYASTTITTMSHDPLVVPSGAVYARLKFDKTHADGGTLHVFRCWGTVNDYAGSEPPPDPLPYTARNQLRELGWPASFGRHRLRQWRSKIAKINQGQNEQAVIACIGHSWWQFKDIWVPFRDGLQDLYGDAGVGYISFYHGDLSNSFDGYTLTQTGTWGSAQDEGTGALAVDLTYERTADVATPGGWSIVAEGTDFDIYYLLDPDAGSFQWRVDGGAWSSDVSAAAATGLGVTTISGLSNASHTIEAKMTVAGSLPGIKWFNVVARKDVPGVIVHKIGNGGSHLQDILDSDEDIWIAGLVALNPDVVLLQHDINDRQAANINPATDFVTRYRSVIARVRAAVPTADIVIVSSGEATAGSPSYLFSLYVDAARMVAAVEQTAYYDAYTTLGSWDEADARGLMTDNAHVNAYGGQLIASDLIHDIFEI